jgi:chemotaxis protein MotA
MENLADPAKLGSGIAVAFVATVYGVGAANLFFLPLAGKLKFKLKEESSSRMMIIMGLVGLAQGENPRLLQEKLEGYLPESERTKEEKK